MSSQWQRYRDALSRTLPDAVELRHRLHADPRLGGQEETVARTLADRLGVPDAPSVAAGRILRFGPATGPAIALRAELDALPIVERTGVDWASTNGAMHACGHDVHLAALVAVVEALRTVEPPTPLVAVLQPREETYPSGARDILGSPEWARQGVGAVLGAHVQPALARGVASSAPGAVNAASDEFVLTVRGRGGHAAYPHTLHDPVLAAAAIVTGVQHLVSRRSDPMEPSVLSIGSIHGGGAANVVPDTVELAGTIRTFGDGRRRMLAELEDAAAHLASAHGCTATLAVSHGEPVLRNDEELVGLLTPMLRLAGLTPGAELRSCGSDDFAYYGQDVPAAMIFVGTGDGRAGAPGLHHAEFLPPDESVRDVAMALLAGFAAAEALLRRGPERMGVADPW